MQEVFQVEAVVSAATNEKEAFLVFIEHTSIEIDLFCVEEFRK